MFYLGVDGGGTKTKFVLYNESLDVVDTYLTSTSHIKQVGYEGLVNKLNEGINYFKLKELPILCLGLAGYGIVKKYKEEIDKVLKENFSNYEYHLINDIESAYYGALGFDDGLVMIIGTGSIAYQKTGDSFKRIGGYGPIFGDEASGYDIGKKTINVFLKQYDGRYEKTVLFDRIMNEFSLNNPLDIVGVLGDNRTNIANVSKITYELYNEDIYCKKIFEEVSKDISDIINSIETTNLTVSFIGGITYTFDVLLPLILEKISRKVKIKEAKNEPSYGAVLSYLNYKNKGN